MFKGYFFVFGEFNFFFLYYLKYNFEGVIRINEVGRCDVVGVIEWFKNLLNNVNWIFKIIKVNDVIFK